MSSLMTAWAPTDRTRALQRLWDAPWYDVGHAQGLLCKASAADPPKNSTSLAGRLVASASGWVLLTVPNALLRGLFDALNAPGVELPYHTDGSLNAHISVMRPEEIATIGGLHKITERGKYFHYQLGPVQEVTPSGWDDMSRVWFVQVRSPELMRLRKTYGLTPLPNDGKFEFHITFAVRKRHVLGKNDTSKAAYELWSALAASA